MRRALQRIGLFVYQKRLRFAVGSRVAVVIVNGVLVIALAHALAGLTLAMLTRGSTSLVDTTATPVAGSVTGESATARQLADVAAIGAWHLFGKVETNRPVAPPPVAEPDAPLNLRLVGIFFTERGGLALIADDNSRERGYRMGASLPGNARLERIERDQVVVSRNGREEVLKLPKLDDPNRPLITPEPSPLLPAPIAQPSSTTFNSPQIIDASAIAKRLRGEVLKRPQALQDIAFASPYVQNGQFVGFRLRPGRDRQSFQQLGLNGGDVLTAINGTRLSSPAQGLTLLQTLMSARQIDVRVLRNGTEVPLTFTLDGS